MSQAQSTLTDGEAYEAMLHFLEAYSRRSSGQPDELAMLLGAMQLNADSRPMDPALWQDWIIAVAKARALKG
jgi:hypothetical protein